MKDFQQILNLLRKEKSEVSELSVFF